MIQKVMILVSSLIIILSCNTNTKTEAVLSNTIPSKKIEAPTFTEQDKGNAIIDQAIEAHGGMLYDQANYSFVFRKKEYRFTNNNDQFTYSVEIGNKGKQITDFIINGTFERRMNQEVVSLSQKNSNKYSERLNSVIYFATLPHKLKDKAVHKKFIETTSIKGKSYDVIKVTFDQEGGGKDYDDVFHYWVGQDDKKIDYLAYKYHVNGGGVRFRSAYNRRVIDGITFQDYINWKAPIGTPLKELPALYEANTLKELSHIKTENIINLKK